VQKLHKLSLSLILSLSLVACGGGLSGTYSNGEEVFDFQSEGKYIFTVESAGIKFQGKYEQDGDNVTIFNPDGSGNVVMTLKDGNTLSGRSGEYKKQ